MEFKYLQGTSIVLGLEKPTRETLLNWIGTVPRKHIERMNRTENIVSYVEENLPWLACRIPAHVRYIDQYNRVYNLLSNHKSIFQWSPERIQSFQIPCPFLSILEDAYINPVFIEPGHTRGCTVRAILAVRNYVISQDILDLEVAPVEEVERVMNELEKESLFSKCGEYWIPTKFGTKSQSILYPSFSFYLMNPIPSRKQVFAGSYEKVTNAVANDKNFFLGTTEEVMGDVQIYVSYSAKKTSIENIYFVVNGRQEELLWTEKPHWHYRTLSRIQGIIYEISKHKLFNFFLIYKSNL